MKKTLITIITILGLAILGLGAVMIVKPYRIYPGDRIKGRIEVTVDGKPVGLSADDFKCIGDTIKVKKDGTAAKFGVKAGDYGKYIIGVSAAGLDDDLRIEVYQSNWWSVCSMEISADIDTSADTISWNAVVEHVSEEGKREKISESGSIREKSLLYISN